MDNLKNPEFKQILKDCLNMLVENRRLSVNDCAEIFIQENEARINNMFKNYVSPMPKKISVRFFRERKADFTECPNQMIPESDRKFCGDFVLKKNPKVVFLVRNNSASHICDGRFLGICHTVNEIENYLQA